MHIYLACRLTHAVFPQIFLEEEIKFEDENASTFFDAALNLETSHFLRQREFLAASLADQPSRIEGDCF